MRNLLKILFWNILFDITLADDPWYLNDFQSLTKDVPGGIGKGESQATLLLPGADPESRVFPVATNGADQPTVVAGYYGQGRFVFAGDWGMIWKPDDESEEIFTRNIISWVAGDPDLNPDEVRIAHRDSSKISGHTNSKNKRNIEAVDLADQADKYSVYAGSSSEVFSEADVEAILEWVGQTGKGLILAGKLAKDFDTADSLLYEATVNLIAKEFGTLFSYADKHNVAFNPSNGPPGTEAFFYPGVTEDPLATDLSLERFFLEVPLVVNKDNLNDPNYDVIFQESAAVVPELNAEETINEYSNFVADTFPLFLLRDDLPEETYQAAWNIDIFPGDVGEGAEMAATVTIDFEESSINDVQLNRKRYYYPLDYYAKGGDIVTMTFSGPIIGSGSEIQVGQHVLTHKSGEGRTPKITQWHPIIQEVHKISNPWGGQLNIKIPHMTAIPLSTITIEGAYDMVVFKLDQMTDEEFIAKVQESKVPWVDLQAPGWFSLVPTTEYAKTITEPTKIMDFWRDKMQAVSRFAGFGDTRPRMERCVFDPAAIGVLYGGYPIEINPNKQNQYLSYDNYHDRADFTWGMYHEVGHGHQQDWWNIIGECTVNWFSIAMSLATENITDERWTYKRPYQIVDFSLTARTQKDLKSDVWTCLTSYAMLGEEFGYDSMTETMVKYLDSEEMMATTGDDRWRLWALEFSKTVGANTCTHFEWWGWPIDDETRNECQKLPGMENLMEEYLELARINELPECDEGWTAYDGVCIYADVTNQVTWSEANDLCLDMGAELASCLSRKEGFQIGFDHRAANEMDDDDDVDEVVEDRIADGDKIWIGLHDRDGDFRLRWLDGTEINPDDLIFARLHNPYKPEPYLAKRDPGECGYMNKGYVSMGRCGKKMGYICKKGGNQC